VGMTIRLQKKKTRGEKVAAEHTVVVAVQTIST